MKRCLLLFYLIFLCSVCIAQDYDDLRVKFSNYNTITIQKEYTTDTNIIPNEKSIVNGISVSGSVKLHDRTSMVRVVVFGDDGSEYLVWETFYLAQQPTTINFENTAFETELIKPTTLKNIKIVVVNAELTLKNITYSLPDKEIYIDRNIDLRRTERLHRFSKFMAQQWNEHNKISGDIWIADTTALSTLTYSQKKAIFNATDDRFNTYGMEYYVAGFFVFPSEETGNFVPPQQSTASQYVDYFDWRNRHGQNWMTPVKNQLDPFNDFSGNGGCWAMAVVGTVEAYANLYYNKHLSLDLSEQEIGVCTPGSSLHKGGLSGSAFYKIKKYGVVNESCFPWQNDSTIPCSNVCDIPDERIFISQYNYVLSTESRIKSALIQNGPLCSGISNNYLAHAMVLCGFGTIQAGDTLNYTPPSQNSGATQHWLIPTNSPYIGQTYWIFKNSYGLNHNESKEGYFYAIVGNIGDMFSTICLSKEISSINYTTSDIAVTDDDNDGYYFWGLGNKPSHCPICCPDIPDGDDSNPNIAEMNQYGKFADYVFPYDTIFINTSRTLYTDSTCCGNLVIQDGATLTIKGNLTMNPAAQIYVRGNGNLIVNGGSVVNSAINVKTSGKLQLLNNGKLKQHRFGCLNIEPGATTDLNYGEIIIL